MTKSGGDKRSPLSDALGRILSSVLHFRSGSLSFGPLKFWLNFQVPWTAWTSSRFLHHGLPWQHRSSTSRVMVKTNASTRVRGAVFEGIPASWLWSEPQSQWHINRLELEAVFLVLKYLWPQLEQRHVLIRTDNMSVVSYINH